MRSYVEGATSDGYAEEWNLEQLWTALKTLYPVSLTIDEVIEQAGGDKSDLTRELLLEELIADARSAYDVREEDLGSEVLRELERRVLLTVIDSKWREHLYEMDYLREGIGLRAMAQRDPLVEYQREGFDMFSAMMDGIQEQSVGLLFHLEVQIEGADGTPEPPVPVRTNGTRPAVAASENGSAAPQGAAAGADGLPTLDEEKLAAAQQAHERPRRTSANPQISAKGLERTASARPLVYSAPSLDQAGPEVHTGDQPESADDGAPKRPAGGRANPNRGSRGNRSSGGRRRR